MSLPSRPPWSWAWLCLLLACTDPGEEQLEKASKRHELLLAEGRPLTDVRFDEVLRELEAIPPRSGAAARAQRLAQAIRAARGVGLESPLAVSPRPDDEAELVQARQRCQELAKLLGPSQGPTRASLADALQKCGERVRRLEEEAHRRRP